MVKRTVIALLVLACSATFGLPAGAHTDSDTVAVPAGGVATVTFRPTHGCAGAPTLEVSVRAPLEGATAGVVDGWQESAEPDGEGNTILKWSGGTLPADQAGAFPMTFTTPEAVGELLTFPAVQICEGDAELAWIDGDPEGEYPAPRLLVLPAGSEPAANLDEVPADAPGRAQLSEIVDVDNPAEVEPTTTSEAAAPTTSETGDNPATAASADEEGAAAPTSGVPGDEGGDGGSSGASALAIGLVVLGALAVAGYMVVRRRSTTT